MPKDLQASHKDYPTAFQGIRTTPSRQRSIYAQTDTHQCYPSSTSHGSLIVLSDS